MLRLSIAVLLGLGLAAPAAAAQNPASNLEGSWSGPGGIIRGQTCPDGNGLCVVVVAGNKEKESMADIVGQTVVRDLVSDGPGKWHGRYIGDGKDLVATVTQKDPDHVEMRVCLLSWFPWLLCETPQYTRVR